MKPKIPGVIIRCSYTSQKSFSLHKDKCFEQNIVNAYKAGMKIGVYHYSQAVSETEAIQEARFVIDALHVHRNKISLEIAFDWEFGGRLNAGVARKIGKQRCKQICEAFCRTIKIAGYEPMVYANLYTLTSYIASDLYKTRKIWVAQYAPKCSYKHPKYMWQYTSGGSVPGISGRVDMNYVYGSEMKPSKPEKLTTYPGKLPVLPARGWFTSGDKGTQVKLMQLFLNWFFGYERLDPDGEVGRLTMEAVRDYEGIEKLKPIDGLFGEKCLDRAKTVRR
jgi:hypothetical protein